MNLKIPPALTFAVAAFLMWVLDQYLLWGLVNFSSPDWLVYVLGISGAIAGFLGVVQFASIKTTVNPHTPQKANKLVQNGVYKISRNPMYLGLLIILIAFGIKMGNGISFVILPAFIWYMNTFQIMPEEEILKEKFGSEYSEYQKKVRRWI